MANMKGRILIEKGILSPDAIIERAAYGVLNGTCVDRNGKPCCRIAAGNIVADYFYDTAMSTDAQINRINYLTRKIKKKVLSIDGDFFD